jgi:hypothetical protein
MSGNNAGMQVTSDLASAGGYAVATMVGRGRASPQTVLAHTVT